jgi:hypothetical protein
MNIQELFEKTYNPLFGLVGQAPAPPLLAHYTSIKVMESIFSTRQIWFSDPLFMNDLQEVRFGIHEGYRLFSDPNLLKRAVVTDPRVVLVRNEFINSLGNFDTNELLDTYVFCLSEHKEANTDGLLSMWRGYGDHGDGAARF